MAFEVLDEHEQGELVRKWLRANAMSILVGIVIGLLLIFGYQQWQAREAQTNAEAATQYAAFVEAINSERNEEAKRLAETLRKDFTKSPYAVFAALRQAEVAVGKADLETASSELTWASQSAAEAALKSLVALRLAKLRLAQGDAEAALKQLDQVAKTDYASTAGELRGDALAKLGRTDDAKAAYTEALSHMDAQSAGRSFVEMKLGDLAAKAEKQKS
jgi:predicted negative regulator of RcsB-dependent stress response